MSCMDNTMEYISDFEINSSYKKIDEFERELSNEEEFLLQNILTLEQNVQVGGHFVSDLLNAVKQGALDFVDSMTDTTDSISNLKRSNDVSKWDKTVIEPTYTSANEYKSRTMAEANKSAPLNEDSLITEGMSEDGKKLLASYVEAYSQRTKSLNKLSKDGCVITRSNREVNYDTLAGLRGYRIGPVVPMPTAEQAKEDYEYYLKNKDGVSKTPSSWLYEQNIKQFDTELAKQLGFKSAKEANEWRKENKLTVHEDPDGMFMVPNDVHNSARHNGYRSMMSKYIKGQISAEEMNSYIRHEKIAYVKHEVKERGMRAVKGIGLSAIKDLLKCGIVVFVQETACEFKQQSNEKFVHRMFRVIKQCWIHVKNKCKEIVRSLWKNIKGSMLSEFLTVLNDFFFKTFKNIFKIVRQMFSSIKNAFKIICNNQYSVEDRAFEAIKILTAGFIGVVGFSLNELMEKGLISIGIPFASFISECLSGLFSGIMSAVVLMLFDNFKSQFKAKSSELKLMQLRSKRMCIEIKQMSLESLRIYKKLDEHIGLALSFNTTTKLSGSIQVCEDLGINSSDICRTTSDVDAVLSMFRH